MAPCKNLPIENCSHTAIYTNKKWNSNFQYKRFGIRKQNACFEITIDVASVAKLVNSMSTYVKIIACYCHI